ncbi:MAG: c-type cytochrome [Burkholderiaceae bacterium]
MGFDKLSPNGISYGSLKCLRNIHAPFEAKIAGNAHGYCVVAFVTLFFCIFAPLATAQDKFPGIGRAATPAEIKAWDIDVRGDFTGLPPGKGSATKGMEVWEAKCASCHGVFGESNETFPPIVGGTTKQDMQTGRVASLTSNAEAQRTTLMKLSRVSTLWDYINRAMPWNAPKTLTTEEVYAVTAYILHLGDIVPADFVLSDQNMRDVQAKLPNRNGTTRDHGLWSVRGKPDVRAVACMKNCDDKVTTASQMPDHARNAHGNLAQQQRALGGVRGADTTQPPLTTPLRVATAAAPAAATQSTAQATAAAAVSPSQLAGKFACTACHAANAKLVGPSWQQIAEKYKTRSDAAAYLSEKIRAGGQGVWGAIPMPAQPGVSAEDAATLAKWVLTQ